MLPDPDRQIFTSGILQPLNIIEVMVIELIIDRCKSRFNVAKVHNPTRLFPHRTFDGHCHEKGMAVETRAFVSYRNIRQAMCRLDTKLFVNLHFCAFKWLLMARILGPTKRYVYSCRKRLTAPLNSVECAPLSEGG